MSRPDRWQAAIAALECPDCGGPLSRAPGFWWVCNNPDCLTSWQEAPESDDDEDDGPEMEQ